MMTGLNLQGLLEHQKPAAEILHKALLSHGSALDASDLGTGKTHVSTVLLRNYNLPALVVCPLAVRPGWARAAALQGTEFDVSHYDILRTGRTPYGEWLIHPNSPKKKPIYYFKWSDDIGALAFDEVHRCKADDSDQAKMLIAARRQGIPTLMLSATPATGPHEMRAIGYHLGLHAGSNWWRWAQKNGCIRGEYGGLRFVDSKSLSRAARMKAIFDDLQQRGLMARMKVQRDNTILAELYDVEESPETLDGLFTEVQSAIEELNNKAASDKDPEHPLTRMLRAAQKIELIKTPIVEQLIADDIAQGRSVVVFCRFKQTMEELNRRLKPDVFPSLIHGDQTAAQREQQRLRFQQETTRVCLAIDAAGDVGIDLHDTTGNHPRSVYHLPCYSALRFRQATGRTARAGMKSPVIQRVILLNGSKSDRHTHASLAPKLNNLDALIDGDLTPGNLTISGKISVDIDSL